jgi:catechol 2,3-dioxygenase-like lactoylglutathione lyase family enzyme
MLHRRSTATSVVAVLLPLAAALTSCGFDYPTDRVNTIAAGTNNRDASVDVLGARVVAYSVGQGRLIGTLVYNDNDAEEPATLDGVSGDGVTVADGESTGVEVAPSAHVNLAAEDTAIPVTGEFTAGDFLDLTYTFSTGESVTLEVPVVKPCGQYADITAPDSDAGDAAEEAGDEVEEDEAAGSEGADATFLCDHPTESAEGEEGGH